VSATVPYSSTVLAVTGDQSVTTRWRALLHGTLTHTIRIMCTCMGRHAPIHLLVTCCDQVLLPSFPLVCWAYHARRAGRTMHFSFSGYGHTMHFCTQNWASPLLHTFSFLSGYGHVATSAHSAWSKPCLLESCSMQALF
jgi:hypothetical protein